MRLDAHTYAESGTPAASAASSRLRPWLSGAVLTLAGVLVAAVAIVLPAVRLGTSPYVGPASTGPIGLPAAAIIGAIWIVLLAVAVTRFIRRVLNIGSTPLLAETRLVVAGVAVLLAVGIDWGLPGPGWALDEMGADAVLAGLYQRFANGWSDQYPPLHYYILAVVYAPVLVIEKLGLFAASWPAVKFLLLLHTRLVSLAMSIGTVALMGLLGQRMLGRRYGWLVALCSGLFLPFVFYAKTANLEAPYLFWTALSLLFLVDVERTGRSPAWIGAGVAGALAVVTKDQAYGSFSLPFLWLIWTHLRNGRGVKPPALGVAAGVATFATVHNIPFNLHGFLAHVEMVVGPASQPFRMFDATAAGQVGLASVTGSLLLWMFGMAGVAAVILGLPALAKRAAPRLPIWLLLAPVSYYLTFLVPAGYVYDRFLLPVVLTCSPIAAVGLRRLLDGWPSRSIGRALGLVMLAALVWRAGSVDALLLRDSRHRAEAWMSEHIPPGSVVAASTQPAYLPRVFGDYSYVPPTVEATLEHGPEFIVVNVEYHRRHPPDSPRRLWFRWLESGAGPYEQVFRYKAPLRWSALRIGRRFRDAVEDPLTNLDKINPEIAIFQRRGG